MLFAAYYIIFGRLGQLELFTAFCKATLKTQLRALRELGVREIYSGVLQPPMLSFP